MDEQISGSSSSQTLPPELSYKDRSAGLTAFGILTMLLGGLSALFALFSVFNGLKMAHLNTGGVSPLGTVLQGVVIYGGLAIALVWVGFGSVKCRKWARALALVFSWTWLICGILGTAGMSLALPSMLSSMGNNPDAARVVKAVIVAMVIFMGLFSVVLPAIWTYFYMSPHVKATCEARDPVPRWTDSCPVPVLTMCCWLAAGVPMMLLMPIAAKGVMPFFGNFISGWGGSILCVLFAVIWGVSAWLLYKLDLRGWWLVLIACFVFFISSILTYTQHDFIEVYKLMGYSQEQIEMMSKFSFISGKAMGIFTSSMILPLIGYLFFIRRFFDRQPDAPSQG